MVNACMCIVNSSVKNKLGELTEANGLHTQLMTHSGHGEFYFKRRILL